MVNPELVNDRESGYEFFNLLPSITEFNRAYNL